MSTHITNPLTLRRLKLADFIEQLSPSDLAQTIDLMDYLLDVAGPGNRSGFIAEGSLAQLMLRQPPAVQHIVKELQGIASTPRENPYEDKKHDFEILASFGFDARAASMVMDVLDATDVLGSTVHRMGMDDGPQRTDRTDIEEAVEVHEPMRRLETEVNDYVANSSEGLSLKQTITTCGNHYAQSVGQDYEPTDDSPPTDLRTDLERAIHEN